MKYLAHIFEMWEAHKPPRTHVVAKHCGSQSLGTKNTCTNMTVRGCFFTATVGSAKRITFAFVLCLSPLVWQQIFSVNYCTHTHKLLFFICLNPFVVWFYCFYFVAQHSKARVLARWDLRALYLRFHNTCHLLCFLMVIVSCYFFYCYLILIL